MDDMEILMKYDIPIIEVDIHIHIQKYQRYGDLNGYSDILLQ